MLIFDTSVITQEIIHMVSHTDRTRNKIFIKALHFKRLSDEVWPFTLKRVWIVGIQNILTQMIPSYIIFSLIQIFSKRPILLEKKKERDLPDIFKAPEEINLIFRMWGRNEMDVTVWQYLYSKDTSLQLHCTKLAHLAFWLFEISAGFIYICLQTRKWPGHALLHWIEYFSVLMSLYLKCLWVLLTSLQIIKDLNWNRIILLIEELD